MNADKAEYTVETPSDTSTWVEDVQSNGKYFFSVVGNKNFTKSLEVYSAEDKKLVKTVLMADNTTYLTTKDSKLTVNDDFAVLDLHAFPYQMPKKKNMSYAIPISDDPNDWPAPHLLPSNNYLGSVAKESFLSYQLVRDDDGHYTFICADTLINKYETIELEV